MKPIWKGSIGFGLVNIPVKLYSATQQSALDLDMVDRRDGGKIHFHRVNENTGHEVKWEDIAKAYKFDGEYIMLTDEDFAEAAPEKSKIIEIRSFVNEKEIDTIYFENSYYIEPEKSGAKAYALLHEALEKSEKVGIAQFVLRTSEALAVLKPMRNMIVLSKIRFAEEIRSTEELNIPARSEVRREELKMALSLIDQYSVPFDIEKFKNEYSASLLKIIYAKASGKRPVTHKLKAAHAKSKNLLAQLKESLHTEKAI